jgi:hypothetical protein
MPSLEGDDTRLLAAEALALLSASFADLRRTVKRSRIRRSCA